MSWPRTGWWSPPFLLGCDFAAVRIRAHEQPGLAAPRQGVVGHEDRRAASGTTAAPATALPSVLILGVSEHPDDCPGRIGGSQARPKEIHRDLSRRLRYGSAVQFRCASTKRPGENHRASIVESIGRGERIRTSDPSVPNRVLYQAEPRPDNLTILPYPGFPRRGNTRPYSRSSARLSDAGSFAATRAEREVAPGSPIASTCRSCACAVRSGCSGVTATRPLTTA